MAAGGTGGGDAATLVNEVIGRCPPDFRPRAKFFMGAARADYPRPRVRGRSSYSLCLGGGVARIGRGREAQEARLLRGRDVETGDEVPQQNQNQHPTARGR